MPRQTPPEARGPFLPERTALYRLVQQHHETWLARKRKGDPDAAPIPRYPHHRTPVARRLQHSLQTRALAAQTCNGKGPLNLLFLYCVSQDIAPNNWSSSVSIALMAASASVALVAHTDNSLPSLQAGDLLASSCGAASA